MKGEHLVPHGNKLMTELWGLHIPYFYRNPGMDAIGIAPNGRGLPINHCFGFLYQ